MRDDRRGGAVGKVPHHLHGTVAEEGKEIHPGSIALQDLEATGVDLRRVAPAQFGCKTVVALDERDAPRGGLKDVNRERTHAGADLDKMITRSGLQPGDDGAGKVRVEEEVLPEHLARPHPDLLETGAEFGFGHGVSIKP